MSDTNTPEKLEDETLLDIISSLRKLDPSARKRVIQTVATHLEIDLAEPGSINQAAFLGKPNQRETSFSADRTISPKEFMLDKEPHTDIEKIACLAYYLTHYRNTPEFRTVDLSKLNTEAAQLKLSNPAFATDNATKAGLLIVATKGNKKISAIGERCILALPNRDAARAILSQYKPRKKSRKQESKEEGQD